MTQEELVRQALQTQRGFDADPRRGPHFADSAPAARQVTANISTLMIQLTCAAATSLDVDLFRDTAVGSAALPAQLTNPTGESYRSIARYMLANPSNIRGVQLTSSENTSDGGAFLASLKLIPKRWTPFGSSNSNEILVQNSQTSQDFRANMTQVPFVFGIDGFNYLNVTSGANGTADPIVVTLAFQFGARIEKVRELPDESPVAGRPGGFGIQSLR